MAVWLLAWAKNSIGNLEETAAFLQERPLDIALDLAFLKASTEHKFPRLDLDYHSRYWRVELKEDALLLEYDITGRASDNSWSLYVWFYKDIISFSGPFEHFSSWYYICQNNTLAEGWLAVVKAIFTFLSASDVTFFTEWGFAHEEAEQYQTLADWVVDNPTKQVNGLRQLVDHDKLFVLKLS